MLLILGHTQSRLHSDQLKASCSMGLHTNFREVDVQDGKEKQVPFISLLHSLRAYYKKKTNRAQGKHYNKHKSDTEIRNM